MSFTDILQCLSDEYLHKIIKQDQVLIFTLVSLQIKDIIEYRSLLKKLILDRQNKEKCFNKILTKYKITELNIDDYLIGYIELKNFNLKNFNSLKELNLINNNLGPKGVTILKKSLQHIQNLTCLNISNNKFKSNWIIPIQEILGKLTSLEILNISNNFTEWKRVKITDIVTDIDTNILTSYTSLTSLNISNNNAGPRGAKVIAKILLQLPKLKYLDVSNNRFCKEGATYLAKTLGQLTTLTELDLSNNGDLSLSVAVIVNALLYCSLLTSLKIKNNYLGHTSIGNILQITSLEKLDFSNNLLASRGANIISELLPNCLSLAYIDIRSNHIYRREDIINIYEAKKLLIKNKVEQLLKANEIHKALFGRNYGRDHIENKTRLKVVLY